MDRKHLQDFISSLEESLKKHGGDARGAIRFAFRFASNRFDSVGRLAYKITCVDEEYWPAAVRAYWGNPNCTIAQGG